MYSHNIRLQVSFVDVLVNLRSASGGEGVHFCAQGVLAHP